MLGNQKFYVTCFLSLFCSFCLCLSVSLPLCTGPPACLCLHFLLTYFLSLELHTHRKAPEGSEKVGASDHSTSCQLSETLLLESILRAGPWVRPKPYKARWLARGNPDRLPSYKWFKEPSNHALLSSFSSLVLPLSVAVSISPSPPPTSLSMPELSPHIFSLSYR